MLCEKHSLPQTAFSARQSSSTHLLFANQRPAFPSGQIPPHQPPPASCSTFTPPRHPPSRYNTWCKLRNFYAIVLCFRQNGFQRILISSVASGSRWERRALPASPLCFERSHCRNTGVQLCLHSLLCLHCFTGTACIKKKCIKIYTIILNKKDPK